MRPDGPATAGAPAASDAVAIICGGGSFPAAVAEAVIRQGRRPVMFAISGWADPEVAERYAHHWIALGQAGRFISLAKSEHCRDAVLIGTVLRPPLSQIRLDWLTLRSLPRIVRFYSGGDDRLLSGVAKVIEEAGLRVVGLRDLAPEIFVPAGALGGLRPTLRDERDIARALQVIRALGPFDVGQAAVVADNQVLAVEAAEGTDSMLLRIADLRRQGRVATAPGVGVLVKALKPGQDRRFDLPAIGPQTVANVINAGLAGLAVTAGTSIIADGPEAIAAADRAGIFLFGVTADAAP